MLLKQHPVLARIDDMPNLPHTLRHSSDREPGISRKAKGTRFAYYAPDGTHIRNEDELMRIETLGLPPAYSDVWICADARGHIQATGRDDKTRKQYRYHDLWRDFRDKNKYERLAEFGKDLPRIRAKVSRDLRRDIPDFRFVCAALTRLIDQGALRIGSQSYAGDSYGATTLRTRHLKLTDDGFKLDFKAKGGKRVRKIIRDKTLARTLEQIDDLPGRDLFNFIDESGALRKIDSADVNAYIHDDFTAKTFRTWHGTVAAFEATHEDRPTIKSLSERAAKRLHNTPAICRSSYIHPKVIDLVGMDAKDRKELLAGLKTPPKRGLKQAERACLALIST